ncbi:unnamed protein product [marine sediment metagenome]|uniref:Polysaccharide chain length determinant N-terminal domain-containing protein n=1 Tax=marine sediment metagenome TaxID=412755 RepID=X1RWB4_9ZZZZ
MTQQESNQKPYRDDYPHEDEINLIDYLRVIWKRKWLIIGGTFICFILASIISLQMPKIYTISMLVKPGIIGVKDNGNYTYMDFMGNAGSKINEGLYNNEIIR